MPLKTKNVFITGGAQGLGKTYADALLAEGAKVVFGDINPEGGQATEKEFSDKYGADKVKFVVLDVTNESKFEGAFGSAVEFLGHVDLMVNNAGIMNEGIWKKMIDLNFTSMVKGTYLAQEHMRKDKGGKGGRIVNISSLLGIDDLFLCPVYCGTKNAIRSFTTSLAIGPTIKAQGIEFGVLCPGLAETQLALQLDQERLLDFDAADFKSRMGVKMSSAERICEGFMKLVSLDQMNGAVLVINKAVMEFVKVQRVSQGETWPLS